MRFNTGKYYVKEWWSRLTFVCFRLSADLWYVALMLIKKVWRGRLASVLSSRESEREREMSGLWVAAKERVDCWDVGHQDTHWHQDTLMITAVTWHCSQYGQSGLVFPCNHYCPPPNTHTITHTHKLQNVFVFFVVFFFCCSKSARIWDLLFPVCCFVSPNIPYTLNINEIFALFCSVGQTFLLHFPLLPLIFLYPRAFI